MTWNGVSTGMIRSALKIVCDSGPIIHLDELNCLHLLEDFQEVIIPDAVHKELKRYRSLSFNKLKVSFIFPPRSVPDNTQLLTLCRIFALDVGEIEALALMEKNPQGIFLTDDASARMAAEQMGFRVHGTIGILVRAIRRGQMSGEEVLGILQKVPSKSTLYIKPSLLDEIIREIRVEFNL
jgi:predicted nucleic acid-binding protein